ncbi:hypothetical protein ABZP36_028862 [Zizania latifolia]
MASTKVQRIMTQPIVRSSTPFLSSSSPLVSEPWVACAATSPNGFSGFGVLHVISAAAAAAEPHIPKARIQIWLFEQKDLRIEGRIIGFDEYMNLVLEDAEEINVKKDTRKPLDLQSTPPLRLDRRNPASGEATYVCTASARLPPPDASFEVADHRGAALLRGSLRRCSDGKPDSPAAWAIECFPAVEAEAETSAFEKKEDEGMVARSKEFGRN